MLLVQSIIMCKASGHTENLDDNEHSAKCLDLGVGISRIWVGAKIYTWSQSLAGDPFKNWAWKIGKLLNDVGGLLSTDEVWNALSRSLYSGRRV